MGLIFLWPPISPLSFQAFEDYSKGTDYSNYNLHLHALHVLSSLAR